MKGSKFMMISLCINTYRRPHIYETLLSVSKQNLPSNIELEYIVSDNDKDGSGQIHIERFSADTGITVNYNIVPQKNIAIARNDAVRRATGYWILFMDDDEIAEPGWVAVMLQCAQDHKADLVQGPVISTFSPGAPDWVVKADPLSKFWGTMGTKLKMASTCNLLVRASLLKTIPEPFNYRFGKMGNDDSEMSYRLYKNGAKIVACDQSPVSEIIPGDRGNTAYLKARFRGKGQGYLYLIRAESSFLFLVKILVIAIAKTIYHFTASELLRFIDKSIWLRHRIQFWINIGKLEYFLGFTRIENY